MDGSWRIRTAAFTGGDGVGARARFDVFGLDGSLDLGDCGARKQTEDGGGQDSVSLGQRATFQAESS